MTAGTECVSVAAEKADNELADAKTDCCSMLLTWSLTETFLLVTLTFGPILPQLVEPPITNTPKSIQTITI